MYANTIHNYAGGPPGANFAVLDLVSREVLPMCTVLQSQSTHTYIGVLGLVFCMPSDLCDIDYL